MGRPKRTQAVAAASLMVLIGLGSVEARAQDDEPYGYAGLSLGMAAFGGDAECESCRVFSGEVMYLMDMGDLVGPYLIGGGVSKSQWSISDGDVTRDLTALSAYIGTTEGGGLGYVGLDLFVGNSWSVSGLDFSADDDTNLGASIGLLVDFSERTAGGFRMRVVFDEEPTYELAFTVGLRF